MCRSSRPTRSPRPFAPASKSARKSSSPIRMPASARTCKDAYPDPYAIRHIGLDTLRRGLSRLSAAALGRDRRAMPPASPGSCRAPIPLARVLVVVSLNLLDPVLDAMEEPQAQPMARAPARRRRAAQSASRVAGRDHCSSIRTCSSATSSFAALMTDADADRPAARATGGVPRGREGVRGQYRRAHGALAAAPAGALHAQPGAGRPAI